MDVALRQQISRLACQGSKQAHRFHLMNRGQKNQEAADQALDRIASAATETAPTFAKSLAALRSIDVGLPEAVKLKVDRVLLQSLADRTVTFTGEGIHGALGVLSDVLNFRDGLGPQTADLKNAIYDSANRAFDEIAGASDEPVLQTATELASTSLYQKMKFAQFPLGTIRRTEFANSSEHLFGLAAVEDHGPVSSLLAERAAELGRSSDEQSTAKLLRGLNDYRLDSHHSFIANKAFSMFEEGFVYEVADYLQSAAPSEEAAAVIAKLRTELNIQDPTRR